MTRNSGYAYRERIQGPGARVLEYLASRHRHSSRDQWLARIELGELRLDGCPVAADTLLVPGQELVWNRPPWDEPDVAGEFQVLFEDETLVAVNKPRGLPTLPGGGFLDTTLVARVRARFPEASPMHRLGRETTGIVLFARSSTAGAEIQSAWRAHHIEKRYRALGSGLCGQDTLVITAPIGPVPHPWLGTLHAACERGKPALSRARVLQRNEDSTLFDVLIETGRPHQIRIHLAFAGHPLYAAGGRPRPELPALPGDGGYFLHAEHLAFRHPVTGEMLHLWAPPPVELRMAGEAC